MKNIKEKLIKLIKNKKFIVGFVLIITAFMIFYLIDAEPNSLSTNGDLIFMKNNKVYTVNIETGEKGLLANINSNDEKEIDDIYADIYNSVYTSFDNTKILFTKNGESGVTLYLNGKNGGLVKICENVKMYSSSKNIEAVVYISGEKDDLYLWKNGENNLIAENVAAVFISENGETVNYYTYDKSIYSKSGENEAKLISTNAYLEYFGEGEIYFTENENLYIYSENGKQLIADKVFKVVALGEAGDLYYVTKIKDTITYKNLTYKGKFLTETDVNNDFKQLKDLNIETERFILNYISGGESEVLSKRYKINDNNGERVFGDHIRGKEKRIIYKYPLFVDLRKGININKGANTNSVLKWLENYYGGEVTSYGDMKFKETVPYKFNDSVIKVKGGEYYLSRPQNAYQNIYYKNENEQEGKLIDTLVGYFNLSRNNSVWYLKGHSGEKLKLYSCDENGKKHLASNIDSASNVSDIRTREFYHLLKDCERISFVINDEDEKYLSPDMKSRIRSISFCGVE
ncbi:MAG: hypothetical protein E7564_11215 [Ruminococcaceae bacterium]|nr:hypothetical protein [Oscillospiraceae bacterium]